MLKILLRFSDFVSGNTDSTKAALDKVDDKWQAACSFQPVVDGLNPPYQMNGKGCH